jgi:transcription elongation factor GreA
MTTKPPYEPIPLPTDAPRGANAALMTEASLIELRGELERLRRRTQVEIAQRLREARAFGTGSNNDEFHAVREEQIVLEARIASLEDAIGRAIVVDPAEAESGAARIGCTVLIEDLNSGAVSQYRLVSAHHSLGPASITPGSPMGQALVGATPGSVVTVNLPNGRTRKVRLAKVTHDDTGDPRPRVAA